MASTTAPPATDNLFTHTHSPQPDCALAHLVHFSSTFWISNRPDHSFRVIFPPFPIDWCRIASTAKRNHSRRHNFRQSFQTLKSIFFVQTFPWLKFSLRRARLWNRIVLVESIIWIWIYFVVILRPKESADSADVSLLSIRPKIHLNSVGWGDGSLVVQTIPQHFDF